MADADKWAPPPIITMHFSQYRHKDSDICYLRLKYSTDAKDADRAKEQANALAKQHWDKIPKELREEHCEFHHTRSILISALGIDANKLRHEETQCVISLRGSANYSTLKQILRLPGSSFKTVGEDGDTTQTQIQTQIHYDLWKATVQQGNKEKTSNASKKNQTPRGSK